ncbi:unnamed protein product [Arabidopsis halleri]
MILDSHMKDLNTVSLVLLNFWFRFPDLLHFTFSHFLRTPGVRQIDHGSFWKSSRNQNGGNLRKEESIV